MTPPESFLTPRFDSALRFASELHRTQFRKGTNIPYIAHLMSVAALVLEAGGNEDQAIAAPLHDAMEDQGGRPTLNKIREPFGDHVANTVEECSDSDAEDPEHKKSWHERKRAYIAHLRHASPDALRVSLADKLHNARSVLNDYRIHGDNLFSRFNREASKQDQLDHYRALVTAFRTAFRKTKAPPGMVEELDRVVTELEQLANH